MNSWGDRIDSATLALMDNRKVAPFSGRRPALVAIDLYDLVYDGGPRPVRELMEEYPASCGEYAWKALPPTIELYEAARRTSVPIVHVTYDSRAETDGKVRPTNRQRMQPIARSSRSRRSSRRSMTNWSSTRNGPALSSALRCRRS